MVFIDHLSIDLNERVKTLFAMLSAKFIFLLAIVGSKLTAINGQFGFGRPFFGNSGGAQGGFSNQNTNFQQHRGGSFGVIAGFGSGGSSTSFSNQNNGGGKYHHFFSSLSLSP